MAGTDFFAAGDIDSVVGSRHPTGPPFDKLRAGSFAPTTGAKDGAPVIFQEVVHSIETGEAVCGEQADFQERSNGLSPECPTDGL